MKKKREEGQIGGMRNGVIEHVATQTKRRKRKRIITTKEQDVKKKREIGEIGGTTKEKMEILVV